MAAVQERNESFRVLFCYQGKRYALNLGKVPREEAEAFAGSVDLTLLRIKQNLVRLPPGVSITSFLNNGGKPESSPSPEVRKVTFRQFKEQYLETRSNGSMEANSLKTVRMHLDHIEQTLGDRFPLQELALSDLQRHVNARAGKLYRGKPLSAYTLRMEIASLRAAWNWAHHMKLVTGPFPN